MNVIACGQRQIVIGGGIDNSVDLRNICFQHGRCAGHLHRLAHLAHFHGDVDASHLIHGEHKCRVGGRGEPGLFDSKFIRARWELRDAIETGIIRRSRIS